MMFRSSEASANMGNHRRKTIYRPGLVLHRRLVSHLSGRERTRPQEHLGSDLDPADLGNLVGGLLSGHLIKRGWSLGAARKAIVVFGGLGIMMLLPTIFTNNLYTIAGLFGFATLSYSAFSTMANVLPSDVFRGESVATVSGLGGAAAGVGTIVASKLIGHFSDASVSAAGRSFDSIVIVAGLVPFIGMILVLLLVRNTKATNDGLVKSI